MVIACLSAAALASGDPRREAAQAAFAEAERLRVAGGKSLAAAIAKYELALGAWRALGERNWEAATINGMALAHEAAGSPERALACYGEAQALAHAARDGRGEAGILLNRGALLLQLKREQEALDALERAVSLYQAARDRAGEASACIEVRKVYERVGNALMAAEAEARSRDALAGRDVLFVGNVVDRSIARVLPKYPTGSGAARGAVTVEVLIAEDGEVIFAVPVEGQSHFYEEAVAAARKWRFAPTLQDGVAVQVRGRIVFGFNQRRGRQDMTTFNVPRTPVTLESSVPDT
jgi:TonB family protein